MNLSLLNSLCYTAGWFWCVLFGIHGQSFVATIGAVFLILFQLYCTKIKETALYIQDVLLVIFSVPLGALLEIFFIQTNLIHYANTTKMLPPIWIVCLYPLFSLLLNHSLKIVKKNNLASFLFGFLGAPLSYVAGISLGGLTFPYPLLQTWIMIGICWGLFLCLLTKIANVIEKATAETLEDRDSRTNFKLLYDGECPICKREICILQKKDSETKIKFIDISSKEFSPFEHNNIDYNSAMSEIHAIDGKGNLLVGIPAFAAVYARCQLLVTSTLLRIPFIKIVLDPLYGLFAKKRLWITGRKDTYSKK
jgi:predicted DCC family thiol-disulfide oxidoreductase YuxK